MSTLIIYGSKYGYTERLAHQLAERIEGEVECVSLKRAERLPLKSYERIVIGTPIYVGNIYKEVKAFLDKHRETLLGKELRFFVVGLGGPSESMRNFTASLDPELLVHSRDTAYFGGAMLLDKMNFLERAVIKRIAKSNTLYEGINDREIERFAKELNGGER